MTQRILIVFCILFTFSCSSKGETKTQTQDVVFMGMCDASGAVPLSETLFAIADDENNVLRVYDIEQGGKALFTYDVSSSLGIFPKIKKDLNKPPKPAEELDIEAATLIGDTAYWITSHGRNKSGKHKPERFHFFATQLNTKFNSAVLVGQPYVSLLDELLVDPRFRQFDLDKASLKAPKEQGGLNIEGMTKRRDGGVWIGFRNPVPKGKALLFSLLNPEEVVLNGESAKFGDPITLSLEDRGVRALSWWRGQYLITAGGYDGGGQSSLYTWDGVSQSPKVLVDYNQGEFNPEAFFTAESRDQIMLFSDDGTVVIDGQECKSLDDATKKQFRGRWLKVPQKK